MNPPPTFLRNTHKHTHKVESTAVPIQATAREQRYTSAEDYRLLWLHTHTQVFAHIELHNAQSAAERQHEHNRTSPSPHSPEHRAGERNESGNERKTEWEAEVRRRDGVKGSRWRRARRTWLSYCNGFQTGLLREFSFPSFEGKSNPSICPPKHTHWSFFNSSFC